MYIFEALNIVVMMDQALNFVNNTIKLLCGLNIFQFIAVFIAILYIIFNYDMDLLTVFKYILILQNLNTNYLEIKNYIYNLKCSPAGN
jgi:hypothetical protein